MVDFRYHIVSIVAIFLALAVGIVLGSGPLQSPIGQGLRTRTDALVKEKDQLRGDITDLQRQNDVDTTFAEDVTPTLVAGRLTGQGVVVVSLPDTDKGLADDVTQVLRIAGATVTGTVGLTDAYIDPTKTSGFDTLAARLVPAAVTLRGATDPSGRIAAALAHTLVTTDPARQTVDRAAARVLSGLQEAGAITISGQPARRARLAVLLAPAAPDPTSQGSDGVGARNRALLAVAQQLDRQGEGAVVGGARQSDSSGGFVAAVRASADTAGAVSTVDIADTAVGRVGVVLALVEQSRGAVGQYGSGSGVDGVLPDTLGARSS